MIGDESTMSVAGYSHARDVDDDALTIRVTRRKPVDGKHGALTLFPAPRALATQRRPGRS